MKLDFHLEFHPVFPRAKNPFAGLKIAVERIDRRRAVALSVVTGAAAIAAAILLLALAPR